MVIIYSLIKFVKQTIYYYQGGKNTMKVIFTTLTFFLSFIFTQEFEIDGNLNVSGNLKFGTIDSLEQVIIELQTQLALLQASPTNGGIAEYTSNTNWTVPDGVHKIYAEIWGGSGSGAGASYNFNMCCGGGGGSGGYVRAIFPVSPGETLEINISDESSITGFRRENGDYIVYATSGEDGEWGSGDNWEDTGNGGPGGTGYINEGIGIVRNGNGGGRNCGGCPGCSGGVGGQPIQGSLASLAASGGSGGNCGSSNGGSGGSGYIYIVY